MSDRRLLCEGEPRPVTRLVHEGRLPLYVDDRRGTREGGRKKQKLESMGEEGEEVEKRSIHMVR